MPKPPAKHKDRAAWSVAEIVEHNRTGAEPLSDDWRAYIADVAQAAGVDPADLGLNEDQDFDPETATVEEHFQRIRRDR